MTVGKRGAPPISQAGPARSGKFVLRAFILLQAGHSLLFVVISISQFVFQDFSFGIWGWRLERLAAALLSLVLTVLILRETTGDKRWEWVLTLILAIDVACYGLWAWTREAPTTKVLLAAQLTMTPFVIANLLKTMRRCGVTVMDILVAGSAVLVAAVVVFLRGTYYPVNSPHWSPAPPLFYRLLAYSDFHWPQEKSLALLMASYLVLSWILKTTLSARHKSRVIKSP